MPKKSPNHFEIEGDTVIISQDGWPCTAMCTYREDYYEELTSHIWQMDKNRYPRNQTLGGGLHRYMMKKWYGEDILSDLTEKGYVVDHINNEHNDCRISNLEFLKKNYNTAKGLTLDKNVGRIRLKLAFSITKDFETGCYQITIACNDNVSWHNPDGKEYLVNSFKLLYSGSYDQYPIVLNDAEGLILTYETKHIIELKKTKAAVIRVYRAPQFDLTEEEKRKAFIIRDGKIYTILGNGTSYIYEAASDKNWRIPDNYDGKQMIYHIPNE